MSLPKTTYPASHLSEAESHALADLCVNLTHGRAALRPMIPAPLPTWEDVAP